MNKLDKETSDQLFILGGGSSLQKDEFLQVVLALEVATTAKQIKTLKSRASEVAIAAIADSARNGTVIPEWAAQHFLVAYEKIDSMELRSWDDALYKPHDGVSEKTHTFEMERKQACVAEIDKWLDTPRKHQTMRDPFIKYLCLTYKVHDKGIRAVITERERNPFRHTDKT